MPLTVHMIGQAHLDPVWLWRWTEGRAEALATSLSAVDRLGEYPAFQFTRGEAQVYEWIEQENPGLFQAIQELVRQGRWHIVNGMVIQPDMNLPQGESFVHQAMLGKGYFEDKFGVDVKVAYCVDSFGHAGTLPQILQKCGFEHYVFMRPQEHEKALPPQAFWWQSPDGSRLLTFRISYSYGTWGEELIPFLEAAVKDKPPVLKDVMCFFGVGNHGGGPTRRQIELVMELARQRQDIDIRFSSIQSYFERVKPHVDALPVVADELQFHATGCYSVNSRLKRLHRQAECTLLQAERMAVLADLWAGYTPDLAGMRRLWHDLCFNQFHDILAGTCIKEAQDEAEMALERVVLGARELVNHAGRQVGARVNTQGPGSTVLFFNPFPYLYQGYVEYEPWTDGERWVGSHWGMVDDHQQPVPCQVIEAQPATGRSETHGFDRLLLRVELPSLGYRMFRFDHDLPAARMPEHEAQAAQDGLENELLSLRLDQVSGNIISCVDKASGKELVGSGGWNVPQVLEDSSDTWSHAVRGFDTVLGQFSRASIRVHDLGPLQASLLVERSWEDASGARGHWLQQLILRAGEAVVLVRNWLHWQGQWRMLKLAFDCAVQKPQGVRDVPFGAFPFPGDNAETPMQMWAAVSGETDSGAAGLALLNDGKYGCDLSGSVLRLTILRSPPYAYHVPHTIGDKQRYDWIDQGQQEFTLALRPFSGKWQQAGIVDRARQLNQGLVPITMHAHPGTLPASLGLGSLESDQLELTALKPAENGDGYILRIADKHGLGGTGNLSWQGQVFPVACAPFEVVTLRIARVEGGWELSTCSMLEKAL